ncbi:MAG TPA: SAM-dependent chlorinase/fluorinase [Leptolyngbyaceae cyanobacterium M65_K2018_010]|nr:SAM-dependent chlorinase/fluorinase [Leptolyngbyaceae cyanobacterium M65_K2018_010]
MITLLTDFGTQDAYVGVMKGIIASRCPTTPVIDLTHAIPPQDIWAARFQLLTAFPYFPPKTIHVVVVDPGVGTHRRAIALQLAAGILVGPDNGVFSGVMDRHPVLQAVELTHPAYWRTPHPSATFQGRDIFVPVAAHLASGVAFGAIGQPIGPDSLVRLDLPPLIATDQGLEGCIQYIDHFGNAVTTIPEDRVGPDSWRLALGPVSLTGSATYNTVEPGAPLALVGSHGFIEIAVNQGSAQRQLGLALGDTVVLVGGRGGLGN